MFEEFLNPKTIAVVGASRTPGKVGYSIVKNVLDAGFEGGVIPVNPSATEVLGLKCYKDVGDYSGKVDLGVVTVPARSVLEAVRSLIGKGVKYIVVITAGFKEASREGAQAEKEIAALCRSAGVRMLGPNVVGFINTHRKLNASFALSMPSTGNISVVTQSGAVCSVLLDWAKGNNIGLGILISIGNKADLTEVDLLSALAEDEDTRVIVGYLEDINAGDEFVKVATHVASKKPVVFLKAGTTQAGKRAASSHTGSLAGVDTAYAAAFKRAGVIRAETFDDLLDYATALSMQPLPKGNRVAVITNAGGLGILAADAVENSGLVMAELSDETVNILRANLSPAASLANPIDVLGDSSAKQYATVVQAVQNDAGVDAIVILFAPQAMSQPGSTVDEVAKIVTREKPVLAAFMGGHAISAARDKLTQNSIPGYSSAERPVRALKMMVDYSVWRNRPTRVVTRFPVNRRRVERIIARHARTHDKEVGEVEAKEILKAYDFAIPEGAVAMTAQEAVEVAQRIGFPVAVKIHSPDIIHKSDFGGVKLNLGSPDAVQDAFELMMLRISRRLPDARVEGVYVEKMIDRGREVILGMTRDPQFGPMLMFGLGGIFVEVMKDVAFNLAPITPDEAMQMLTATRSYQILKGARGQAGVDLTRIAAALQRISQLATEFPGIVELDINPFIVGQIGSQSVVADARMTLDEKEVE
jgi:acetyl coenzyme A synthetase (ADP forming)-like protein